MEILHSDKAPAALGPYSQGIAVNGFVFTSGQLGMIPDTGELAHSMAAQTVQALENVAAVLKEAGLTLDNVVKTTCYLKNMEDFSLFNEIYGQYFVNTKPARSCFQVAKLPKDAMVEIEVIAAK
ncbi:MAG: RidA family protein [Ruminiclostridium sp.]|nr:RidA family protein [Ruminiclostridium sp.]